VATVNADITRDYTLVTTDATPVTAASEPFPINTSGLIAVRVLARRSSTGDTKAWYRVIPVKRAGAGLSVVGTQADLLPSAADAGASTWDIAFSLSGNTAIMTVTGQASATITWYIWVTGGTISG